MSEATAFTFFVSEAEYQKLQAACPADFPFTYDQFVERVDKGIKQVSEIVTVVKAYASVEEFLAWCAKAEIEPNNKSRAEYATVLGRAKRLH